jgi:hypothetical protein
MKKITLMIKFAFLTANALLLLGAGGMLRGVAGKSVVYADACSNACTSSGFPYYNCICEQPDCAGCYVDSGTGGCGKCSNQC